MTSLPISTTKLDGRRLGLPDIAFTGRAGAGKSTAAQLLTTLFDYTVQSFATPLRDAAQVVWGEAARRDRDKLQRLGIAVREIDADAWCNALVARLSPGELTVVDDLRFPNEWWALKAHGFTIIRLGAPKVSRVDRLKGNGKYQNDAQLDHVSESAVDHLDADVAIENIDSEFELYEKLAAVVHHLRTRR